MPLMQDLLDKLQESPPQTEEDLRGILDETGYDLIMKEPSPEEEERAKRKSKRDFHQTTWVERARQQICWNRCFLRAWILVLPVFILV